MLNAIQVAAIHCLYGPRFYEKHLACKSSDYVSNLFNWLIRIWKQMAEHVPNEGLFEFY